MKLLTCAAVAAALLHPLAQAQTIEVMHWWTSPGESKAVKVLADAYQQAGGKWQDTAIAGTGVARKAINMRLISGDPPGAAHYNLGQNLIEAGQEGFLVDLSSVAKKENWASVVPPAIMKSVSSDGKVYGVPVAVHGANWYWYSPKVLKAAGVEPPKTIADMIAAAEKIKAAGYLPFAVSSQGWQLNYLYNNLLLGISEPAYEQLTNSDPNVYRSPAGLKALEYVAKIRSYADAGATNRSWNETTNLVLTDKAAFQFMGDWAKAEFLNAGKKPGVDFGCALTPGAQDKYVFTGDGFGMSAKVKPETSQAQTKLVSVLMDKQTQQRFAIAKGSVPSRTDVPSTGMDECAVLAMKVMKNNKAVIPNVAVALSGDVLGAHYDGLSKFWSTPTMTPTDGAKVLAAGMKAAK